MWVETLRRLPTVPRHLRAAYSVGIAFNLVPSATSGALLGFVLATGTPVIVTAALLFLAPIYFMLAMLVTARDFLAFLPIIIGVILGPVFHIVAPKFDLLLTGLIGGTFSFLIIQYSSKRRHVPTTPQCESAKLLAEKTTTVNASPAFVASKANAVQEEKASQIDTDTIAEDEYQIVERMAWHSFMAAPAEYADQARLEACLNGSFGTNRNLMNGRRKFRLSTLVTIRYGLPTWIAPENCDEFDRAIALAPAKYLKDIIHKADEIFWSPKQERKSTTLSGSTSSLKSQEEAQSLTETSSESDTCDGRNGMPVNNGRVATSHHEESNADLHFGLRCFAAWCDTLPYGIGARVRLKLPASPILDMTTDSHFHTEAVAIVRQAASQVMEQHLS
jgi:hypothetical protein